MGQSHLEDSEERRRLTLVVQCQLRRVLSNSPEELAEYIVVLLAHGKSEAEITSALSEFLHDEAPPFAAWLFAHLEEKALDSDLSQKLSQDGTKITTPSITRPSRGKRDWRSTQDCGESCGHGEGVTEPQAGEGEKLAAWQLSADRLEPEHGVTEEMSKRQKVSPKREDRNASVLERSRKALPADQGGKGGQESHHHERRGTRKTEPPSRLVTTALKSVLGRECDDKSSSKRSTQPHVDGGNGDNHERARGRSVFERLGPHTSNHPSLPNMPSSRPARTSVFERLEGVGGKPPAMNMHVRMDNRTHCGGQSTTFMVTVNNPSTPQGRRAFHGSPDVHQPVKTRRLVRAVKPVGKRVRTATKSPTVRKESVDEADDKMKEIARLRQMLSQMEEDIANLRAKGRMAEDGGVENKGNLSPRSDGQPKSPTKLMADINRRCVVVQNVHFHATKEVLAAHFGRCGKIVDITFVLNKYGFSKGYAFVEFQETASVEKALRLSGSMLMHRVIKVIRKETRLPSIGAPRPPKTVSLSKYRIGGPVGRGLRGIRGGRSGPGVGLQRSLARSSFRYIRRSSDIHTTEPVPEQAGHAMSATGECHHHTGNSLGAVQDSGSC